MAIDIPRENKDKDTTVAPKSSSFEKPTAPQGNQKISLEESLEQRRKNAVLLAGKYTAAKRHMELFCVGSFAVLFSISFYRLCSWYAVKNVWVLLCSNILAMGLADFFSGIVHWAADTWGTLDTPMFGATFIRSFREHHLEPVAMTRHDFVETNGDNCLTVLFLLAFTAFLPFRENNTYDLFLFSLVLMLSLWVMLTNQIHKWSHCRKVPTLVTLLQDYNIILSRKDHNKHHQIPFDRNYCITNGWLNPWLTSIGFWRRTEEVITALTGAIPRADDKIWTSY
eukprot:TRINITY_DN316_c0_g1_i2.p1 TRINITY_DN316_c0_g1~~TRINITY_DN316_c0_g1_i2.p1  ORF type:complete len:313 (-),score=64.39 TRINITY_DN316_c0_g1_i2:112-957(-)